MIKDTDASTKGSTIIAAQPIKKWHEYLNDPTLADAIMDRLTAKG